MPERLCFVIMPFKPELHYFYLYLKQHVEKEHGLLCERADAQVLTKPFPDKIDDYIQSADVIIADCSDRNPNVFYEIGIARALGKKIILITKDKIEDTPSDIRHYELIQYELDKHVAFFERLGNALHNVFADRYKNLYERASQIFEEFRRETHAHVEMASREVFLSLVSAAEVTAGLPSMDDALAVTKFVLPKIIANLNDISLMHQITDWIEQRQQPRTRRRRGQQPDS